MNKGLEALKKIKNYKEWTTVADITGFKKEKVKLIYNNELKQSFCIIEKELKDYERLIEIISKYIKIDDNYDTMDSGSTKAFKVCIPNCIVVEEDDDYIDECYPNSDYDFIDDLLKEVLL